MKKEQLDHIIITNSEIIADIHKRRNGDYNWIRTVPLVLFSILLMIIMGIFTNPLQDLLVLLAVLFIRDLGYLAGMTAFNFNDSGLFTFSFFSRTVSDNKPETNSFRQGITILLGNLPGFIIGFLALMLFTKSAMYIFFKIAIIFTVINTIHIIPLYPLDGGKLLDLIILNRHIYLSIILKIITVVLIVTLTLLFAYWPLAIIGALFILPALDTYRFHTIASGIIKSDHAISQKELFDENGAVNEDILKTIKQRIYSSYEDTRKIKKVSRYILQTWDKLRLNPPGPVKAMILTCIYFFSLSVMALTISEYNRMIPEKRTEVIQLENGTRTKVFRLYLRNKVLQETEISPQNFFSGFEKRYDIKTGKLIRTGTWLNGKLHGEWTFYNQQGEKYRIITFDNGKFKLWRELKNGEWLEKTFDQLEENYKRYFLFHKKMAPEGPHNRRTNF